MVAPTEWVEDGPGDEATEVVRMCSILRNLVMKRRREREKNIDKGGGCVADLVDLFVCF